MVRDLAALLAALGYVLDRFTAIVGTERRTDPYPAEPELVIDESDLRYLADTFDRVNERLLDEIRGWDALSGVLLGTIFAVFVIFIDNVGSFSWWSIAALSLPTLLTAWNFGGRVSYSPDPSLFQPAFAEDPHEAVLNLIEDHKADIAANAALRNKKRVGFWRALSVLIVACLVAAAFKQYNHGEETHGQWNAERLVPQGQAGDQGSSGGHPGEREQRSAAETPDELQLRPCHWTDGNSRSGEDGRKGLAFRPGEVLIAGARGGSLPLYFPDMPLPRAQCAASGFTHMLPTLP